ncbi:FG-GAP-like repeat-containing protein [Pirellulaceae bacterium SH449]
MSQLNRKNQERVHTRIRRTSLLTLGLLSAILVIWVGSKMLQHWRARQLFDDAVQQGALGLLDKGEKGAWQAWRIDSSLPEAVAVAAQFAIQQGRHAQALLYLDELNLDDPGFANPIKEMAWHMRGEAYQALGDISNAEIAFRRLLEVNPENAAGCLSFITLLGTCARRDEAIPYILRLVKLRAAGDTLMLLARESGAIQNEAYLRRSASQFPNDPLPWAALATYAFDANEETNSQGFIEKALALEPNCVPALSLQLRLFAKQDRWDKVQALWESLPRESQRRLREHAAVWLLQGQYLERASDWKAAIGCYVEAFKRRPDSRVAISRLATLLAQTGNVAAASTFSNYLIRIQKLWEVQDRVLFTQTPRALEDLLMLVEAYARCGRLWEAYGWCQLGIQLAPQSQDLIGELEAFDAALLNEPFVMVADSLSPLSKFDWKTYEPPEWIFARSMDAPSEEKKTETAPPIQFVDEAKERGIQFVFHDGTDGPIRHLMFELTGGGIGVLDYDLDGWPDLVFSQGRPWPPESTIEPAYRDLLYRNEQGRTFSTPIPLPLSVDGFGQGIGIGDVNDDGFPDIYIAQTDGNRLLLNGGDGTFHDVTEEAGLYGKAWTTSCLVADVNNDGFPDLYDVNYVAGPDIFTRTCLLDGKVVQCKPTDFESEQDYLWLNDGQGGFVQQSENFLPRGRGLGAVAFRSGTTNGLQMFVTNDVEPNFLLNFNRNADSTFTVEDTAIYSGVAFNENGKAEGSMGIAVHDLNGDGHLDFVVTNFLAESNTLYQSLGEGLYADRTKTSGLEPLSYDALGFGAQFLDANLDGIPELFVANGHVDDLSDFGKPYRMPPQLMSFQSNKRFQLLQGVGEYFSEELLGRAAVKLDWNRDGKMDLVVGHLRDPYSLLTNYSETKDTSLTIRLVGTQSNRDAIGAIVTLHNDGKQIAQQVTSGDGYHASNSREIIFPVVEGKSYELSIEWPSGNIDRVPIPLADRFITIVESR